MSGGEVAGHEGGEEEKWEVTRPVKYVLLSGNRKELNKNFLQNA